MVNLDELMRLHTEATPGPWKVTFGAETETYVESNGKIICETTYLGPDYDDEYRDAAYIAAACNTVPELVARIRELEDQLSAQSLKQVSALEPSRIVSNNNSTPPEWLMHRFTEVK